ncbi:azaleucine resistance protein AzlC [Leclercia adecarboxylata]|uniref:Azaleucine resistance protein AzlC n=1 Tax=Leclercia adecarboxylata TaxID=83655 RepID=A0A4U9J1T6_9ENTR|nr:azaleucine resistance protein AzlC [Leclercia adecarboxylata]
MVWRWVLWGCPTARWRWAYGFPLWVPFVLSISVLAGASEFMFIGIVASGGNPLAAAAAGLLVNARHVPFGVTVRDSGG